MFAEEEWDDTASSGGLTRTVNGDSDLIKEKLPLKGGRKKSLLKTLKTLRSVPDWSSCPAPKGNVSESEAEDDPLAHPKKKKKRSKKRRRGQLEKTEEKYEANQTGDDHPKVFKKQRLDPEVKAFKTVKNTKAVKVEQKEDAEKNEGSKSIEKSLTRKQWKNKMKNKRRCKNKYQDKAKTEHVRESDNKNKSSSPKLMDPPSANNIKPKNSRKAEVKRQKLAAKSSSSSIPHSETEKSLPVDGLVDTSNITNKHSNEILQKPPVKSEQLIPFDKRTLKEKQKRSDKLRHMLSIHSAKAEPVVVREQSTEEDTEDGDMVRAKEQMLDRSAALRSKMEKRLEAARFRYINEILYTTTSGEAKRMFKQDPKAFEVYHLGFTTQVKLWPENPVDTIISFIHQKSSSLVVADFGCGDCKIARSVKNKVHSFDLAPTCDLVTVCDMANVPIDDGTIDIAVFCLSLMGTNLNDFLTEANRVLVMGGVLKIAEVASRFEDVRGFITALSRLGFKITSKETENDYFFLFEFVKVANAPENIKKAGLTLKPCMYKKR